MSSQELLDELRARDVWLTNLDGTVDVDAPVAAVDASLWDALIAAKRQLVGLSCGVCGLVDPFTYDAAGELRCQRHDPYHRCTECGFAGLEPVCRVCGGDSIAIDRDDDSGRHEEVTERASA